MSILVYNGVTVGPLWLTSNFSQEAQFDATNTDYLYTKFTIEGQTILTNTIRPPGLAGQTPVDIVVKQMRYLFMQPRKSISFTVNGKELIPSPMTSGKDCANGPHPLAFNIIQLQGGAFVASLRIECAFSEVGGISADGTDSRFTGSAIISHRWTDGVAMDRSFYSRKTRSGLLRIRSDANVSLDSLRDAFVATSLSPGFVRMKSDYKVQPDGLALQYDIEDQEVYLVPPTPATEAHGEYIESTPIGQPYRMGHVTVRLKGAKTTSKSQLIQNAIQICVTKLTQAGRERRKGISLSGGSVREKMWENEIEVTMQARLKPNKKRIGTNAMDLNRFVVPPVGSAPGAPPPDYGTRGTAMVLLEAAAYNDPKLARILNDQTNQISGADAKNIPGGGAQPI